jgi:hypothetical protein
MVVAGRSADLTYIKPLIVKFVSTVHGAAESSRRDLQLHRTGSER